MAGTFTQLLTHIMFSTKDRQPLITPAIQKELYPYLGGIARNKKAAVLEAGGTTDHVHLLIRLHQNNAIANLVRDLKANSSGWIHDHFAEHGFAWQGGYGAFTVSHSMRGSVARYIQNQEEHHRRRSFKEEFLAMLRRHGVEFDTRYIWE